MTAVLGLFYFQRQGEIYHTICHGDFGDFRRHNARNSHIAVHSRPGLDDARFRATRTFPGMIVDENNVWFVLIPAVRGEIPYNSPGQF